MAAVAALLSESIIPAALGLAVAITTSWGYKHLSARMAEFDIEMRSAGTCPTTWLVSCAFRL